MHIPCSIAYAAQGGVSQQRTLLEGAGRRMAGVAERFPVIGQLMGRVRMRRIRETIIMALFLGILLAITYWLARRAAVGGSASQ